MLLGEADVGGAVYCVEPFRGGKVLAAVNNRVGVYAWDPRARKFTLECSHHSNFVALALRASGDHVVYGDLMRSVSVLMYRPRSEHLPPSLEEVARDFDAKWTTAVEVLGPGRAMSHLLLLAFCYIYFCLLFVTSIGVIFL